MAKNYLEAFAEQWLRLQGYVTWCNVWYWRPVDEHVKQAQWSDIDVIGFKSNEAILVACESFLGVHTIKKVSEKIPDDFQKAMKVFTRKIKNPSGVPCPDLSNVNNLRFLVIAEAPFKLDAYKQALAIKGIEVKSFKEILDDVIDFLKHTVALDKIGRHEDHMIRLLIALINYKTL